MKTETVYQRDKLTDSPLGLLVLFVVGLVAVASLAIWLYLLW